MHTHDRQDFEQQKSASLAHQLIKAGRLVNETGLNFARVHWSLPDLKHSHLALFPLIDFEGTRLSDLAQRRGVSKQFISKQIQEMVGMGLVYLKPDPEDKRAKRVHFYTQGPKAIYQGFKALQIIDQQLNSLFSDDEHTQLLAQLGHMIQFLTQVETQPQISKPPHEP